MNRLVLIFTTTLIFYFAQGAPPITKRDAPASDESLESIFKDVMALIPKDEIKNITEEHLNNDEEFRAAIAYMQSKEWIDLIESIRQKPDWIEFKKFLSEAGIDLDTGIKCIEKLLENVTVTLVPQSPSAKKSLKSFLADVEQTLPTMKIMNLLEEKKNAKGVNFKVIFEKLSSEESHKLLEKVLEVPEVKRLLKELAEMGIDFTDLFTIVYTINGWGEFKPFY